MIYARSVSPLVNSLQCILERYWPLAHLPWCTLFVPQSFALSILFSISLGTAVILRRNEKQRLWKILGGKYGALCEMCKWRIAAWENSPHFATPPVVSSRNDAWQMSAEIPYWWRTVPTSVYSFWLVENLLHPIRSSTQIWVVTGHQYGISALVS